MSRHQSKCHCFDTYCLVDTIGATTRLLVEVDVEALKAGDHDNADGARGIACIGSAAVDVLVLYTATYGDVSTC